MDTTYYAIPANNSDFKLLLIIGFDKIKQKSVLCLIALIKNENVETFSTILHYLKITYNFNPKMITTDCSAAEIIAIRKIFPDSKNIICYYHVIKRCILHLPQIKSKNKQIKKKAKNLLANIKLLLFIDNNKLENFFTLIIKEYKKDFYKFIKNFYKNFFIKFPLNERIWNYNFS